MQLYNTYRVVNHKGITEDICILLGVGYIAKYVRVRSIRTGEIYQTPFFTIRELPDNFCP
jgi:hypothetical protein